MRDEIGKTPFQKDLVSIAGDISEAFIQKRHGRLETLGQLKRLWQLGKRWQLEARWVRRASYAFFNQ